MEEDGKYKKSRDSKAKSKDRTEVEMSAEEKFNNFKRKREENSGDDIVDEMFKDFIAAKLRDVESETKSKKHKSKLGKDGKVNSVDEINKYLDTEISSMRPSDKAVEVKTEFRETKWDRENRTERSVNITDRPRTFDSEINTSSKFGENGQTGMNKSATVSSGNDTKVSDIKQTERKEVPAGLTHEEKQAPVGPMLPKSLAVGEITDDKKSDVKKPLGFKNFGIKLSATSAELILSGAVHVKGKRLEEGEVLSDSEKSRSSESLPDDDDDDDDEDDIDNLSETGSINDSDTEAKSKSRRKKKKKKEKKKKKHKSKEREVEEEKEKEKEKSSSKRKTSVERSKSPKKSRRSRSHSKEKARSRRRSGSRHRSPDKKESKSKSRRSRSRSRDRRSGRGKERTKDKSRSKSRSRDRERDRDRISSRHKKRSRERSRSRDRRRSRSRGRRSRSKGRRSRSRERDRRSRSRGRKSRSPRRRRTRSRSPAIKSKFGDFDAFKFSKSRRKSRSRSRSPVPKKPKDSKEIRDLRCKIDKAKLREIAIKNALTHAKTGTTPLAVTIKAGGKSVEELTEYCKKIQEKEDLKRKSRNDYESSDEEIEMPPDSDEELNIHPFKIKEPAPIVMDIKNAKQLPIVTPAERLVQQSQLRTIFPVSSGSDHRNKEPEWVPVEPQGKVLKPGTYLAIEAPPQPERPPKTDKVFDDPPPETVDISAIVSQRLNAVRKLQENPNDVAAKAVLSAAQKQASQWAQSKNLPGQFLGSTGANIMSQQELIGDKKRQAWLKKDVFTNAAPVTGGIGMYLLQKMGWKHGEGLGKNNEGKKEPLMLDFKVDRRGLLTEGEGKKSGGGGQPKVIHKDLSGKHPVSALGELCNKRRWGAPTYDLQHESGPAHRKDFLYKVTVNGTCYQPSITSTTKKVAKAQAATAVLQQLGLVPRT